MKRIKKARKPFQLWEKILIITSILFIVVCLLFYGNRLIKYYKIYNPKIDGVAQELIMNSIVKNSTIVYENDGLYRVSGMYVYKGANANNYIMYSNMLWRIIKFNTDGSLDVVLDNNINMLKWNEDVTSFTETDVYKYLNEYFYNLIDKTNLTTTTICNDNINDLNKITCENKSNNAYVRLLSVSEYLTSKSELSYISDSNIWLTNTKDDSVWNVNNDSLSFSEPNNMYYVKPVVTLKNTTILKSGKGTKEEPYVVEQSKDLSVGSFVKLGDDIWVIYDKQNETYKLSLNNYLDSKPFGNNNTFDVSEEDSLAYYLNNDYYNSLTYKNILVNADWYSGEYNSYKDVLSSKVNSKVGLLSVADLKLNKLSDYYLITKSDKKVYLYSVAVLDSNPTISNKIVPTIAILKHNITSGEGTINNPYILEA